MRAHVHVRTQKAQKPGFTQSGATLHVDAYEPPSVLHVLLLHGCICKPAPTLTCQSLWATQTLRPQATSLTSQAGNIWQRVTVQAGLC